MLTYQKKFNRKYTLVCVCTYTEVISKIFYYSYISLKQVLIPNYIHDRLDFFYVQKIDYSFLWLHNHLQKANK